MVVRGRVVVKFGGACLSNGEKVRKAAGKVVESGYKEVVVVVSAMGDTTNRLIEAMKQIGTVAPEDYPEVVAMGERTSARIFSAALKAQGADSKYFEPSQDEWPIITDSNFTDAKPLLEETCRRVKAHLEPLLGKVIPVVCGFLGRDEHGRVTTLGRGGSDTTALLLANCLKAEEVILVKETEGVMSADPKIVPDAKPLPKLDIHEMFTLAYGGAKIVKAEALKYKLPNQRLRVVRFSNSLKSGGTEIVGVFNSTTPEVTWKPGLLAVSIVCEMNPKGIGAILSALGDRPVYGISTGRNSLTVFTSLGGEERLLKRLHRLGVCKALSCRGGIGLLEVTHPSFIDSPGWVAKVSGALTSKGINIIEITTSKATINVFIDESNLEEAVKAVRRIFEA
ncbi:MAG: aspartate kinase [Candidatus Bathyarchaeota archaeon B26-1]|nr:MAG: aspartate kinase [Candidatus Bathyarchaeota archaeon B26-1]